MPWPGDLVWTDLDPRVGRGQGGRRPAVVVSPAPFREAGRFVTVCPVTRRVRPFASSVVLSEGLGVQGEVPTGHVRGIDAPARPVRRAGEAVPAGVLAEIRAKLAVLLGIG